MSELLPPNSTTHERNLATVAARIGDVPVPLRDAMNPDKCPLALLPWLAWQLGVDSWKDYWPESVRRARVKAAIPIARRKGTAAAVRDVVASFGGTVLLREWFELEPRGIPGTFDLVMTVRGQEGQPATAAFVADVIAEVERTKPVSRHFTFTQGIEADASFAVAVAARPVLYRRLSISEL